MARSFPATDDKAMLAQVTQLQLQGATVVAETRQEGSTVTRTFTVTWQTHNPDARII
jgi:hypothetical protein